MPLKVASFVSQKARAANLRALNRPLSLANGAVFDGHLPAHIVRSGSSATLCCATPTSARFENPHAAGNICLRCLERARALGLLVAEP